MVMIMDVAMGVGRGSRREYIAQIYYPEEAFR